MAVTPAGMFSAPLGTVRTLLSTLAAVKTWMGVASDAAALARIYINQEDEPDGDAGTAAWKTAAAALRPLIIVGTDQMEATDDDQSPVWGKTASVWMAFQEIAQNENGVQTGSNAVSSTDALLHLMNGVGTIMVAYEAAVSAGGTLHGGGWDLTEQAGRSLAKAVKNGALDLVDMVITLRRRDMR